MDNLLVWTVLIGVLFLVGMLVFLMDRLQTLSNVARFGPPPEYLQRMQKKKERQEARRRRNLAANNVVGLIGNSSGSNDDRGTQNARLEDATTSRKILEGRPLWNVLAGKKTTKRSEDEINAIRQEYKIALTKHITFLFEEGVSHSLEGKNEPPGNVKNIEHGGAEVVSWIPVRYGDELYELGRTAAVDRTEGFILVRRDLEGVCGYLFNEVGVDEGNAGNRLASNLLSNVKQEEVKKPKTTPVSSEVMDMLDNDNSYDDKVALVRVFSSTDLERIAKVVKGMIKT